MLFHLSADYNVVNFSECDQCLNAFDWDTVAQIPIEHLPKIALGVCSLYSSIFRML